MKVTLLGTGTSQGVPVIACECRVCQSQNPKDKRTRTSCFIEVDGLSLVIDTGPDFRQQMLSSGVKKLDAVLFTHEHKDHTAGLDDVRAFNFKHKKAMDVYAHPRVQAQLKREYEYIFSGSTYPGIPKIELKHLDKVPFQIEGVTIQPIEVMHMRLPVLGFRIKNFTYITDAKTIAEDQMELLKGTEVLVLNALRQEEHVSHLNLEEALEIIHKVQPKAAYLTHISHLFGTHDEIQNLLPEGVFVGYDGMTIEI